MTGIPILNKTKFFHRPLFLYALGDVPLKKPLELRKIAFTILFFALWALPIILIFGFKLDPFFFIITFGIPLILANIINKPIFGGKTAFAFLKTIYTYITEGKCYTDLHRSPAQEEQFFLEQEIWISRRRELNDLYRITQGRDKNEL